MAWRPLRPALLLLALTAACKTTSSNPFAELPRTQLPPASAALLYTSNAFDTTGQLPREVYAVDPDGSGVTQISYCNTPNRECDTIVAAPAADRKRLATLRILGDRNRDGQITDADASLVVVDLERAIEADILGAAWSVSGVDWSPTADILVFSGVSPGSQNLDDLFRVDANGQNQASLTSTPDVMELHPRLDPTGSIATYEQITPGTPSQAWVFVSGLQLVQITSGGPAGELLPGTPYLVGSDADPAFSPDSGSLVFRRLTGLGADGRGTWDILTVALNGGAPTPVATGPVFRGPPDWGPHGIVFEESDPASNSRRIVVVQPDGTDPRSIVTLGALFQLSNPRWLH